MEVQEGPKIGEEVHTGDLQAPSRDPYGHLGPLGLLVPSYQVADHWDQKEGTESPTLVQMGLVVPMILVD